MACYVEHLTNCFIFKNKFTIIKQKLLYIDIFLSNNEFLKKKFSIKKRI
jgi:hypothetical protein